MSEHNKQPFGTTSDQVSPLSLRTSLLMGIVQVWVVLEPKVEIVLPEAALKQLSLREVLCKRFLRAPWLLVTEFLTQGRMTAMGQGWAFATALPLLRPWPLPAQSGKVLLSLGRAM